MTAIVFLFMDCSMASCVSCAVSSNSWNCVSPSCDARHQCIVSLSDICFMCSSSEGCTSAAPMSKVRKRCEIEMCVIGPEPACAQQSGRRPCSPPAEHTPATVLTSWHGERGKGVAPQLYAQAGAPVRWAACRPWHWRHRRRRLMCRPSGAMTCSWHDKVMKPAVSKGVTRSVCASKPEQPVTAATELSRDAGSASKVSHMRTGQRACRARWAR